MNYISIYISRLVLCKFMKFQNMQREKNNQKHQSRKFQFEKGVQDNEKNFPTRKYPVKKGTKPGKSG